MLNASTTKNWRWIDTKPDKQKRRKLQRWMRSHDCIFSTINSNRIIIMLGNVSRVSSYYNIIKEYYSDKAAKRSGVSLIRHIDEGLVILEHIKARTIARKAYCLHPIIQSEQLYNMYVRDSFYTDVINLACEYRDKANSYLCRPETDYIETTEQLHQLVGDMSEGCAEMLWADKKQNQSDFNKYHKGYHPRSEQLEKYFELWINYLDKTFNISDRLT